MKETGDTNVGGGILEVLEVFLGVYAFLRVAEGVHRGVDGFEGGMERDWRHLVGRNVGRNRCSGLRQLHHYLAKNYT